MYYDLEEIVNALNKATKLINERTVEKGFVRGYSDCFCFLIEYDKFLRGNKSKADINFEYDSVKSYLKGLRKEGFNLKSYAQYCNYKIQTKPRPKVGDIGFIKGAAIIASPQGWVTTNETNLGVKPIKLDITLLNLLARPIRS